MSALLNLNIHTSYFSHAVNYSLRTTNVEILIGTSVSQMSNFRRVRKSHVFVTPVKNKFELFTCVTNTCEYFTRVTDSFECESQTNLSQVWKSSNVFVTPVKNSWDFFTDVTNMYDSFISVKDSHFFSHL